MLRRPSASGISTSKTTFNWRRHLRWARRNTKWKRNDKRATNVSCRWHLPWARKNSKTNKDDENMHVSFTWWLRICKRKMLAVDVSIIYYCYCLLDLSNPSNFVNRKDYNCYYNLYFHHHWPCRPRHQIKFETGWSKQDSQMLKVLGWKVFRSDLMGSLFI